jgi:hypothetical protein
VRTSSVKMVEEGGSLVPRWGPTCDIDCGGGDNASTRYGGGTRGEDRAKHFQKGKEIEGSR